MAKSFTLSDESVNDHGFKIITAGINLDRFKKNPIMLWMHRRDDGWDFTQVLPIGKWDNIRVEGKKLLADPVFDENDKFAQLIKSKVENDFIKGASIGVRRIAISDDPKDVSKGQTRATITKCEMYEASIVDMPANKNTVKNSAHLFSSNQNDEIPLIKNTAMADKKDETKLTFKSEDDLMTFMKEKFGLEFKAGVPEKKPEEEEEFKFKNENSLLSWFKEKFGLQPKAKPEKKEKDLSTDDEEVENLKTENSEKDKEILRLKSENEKLQKKPGAKSATTDNDTDKLKTDDEDEKPAENFHEAFAANMSMLKDEE